MEDKKAEIRIDAAGGEDFEAALELLSAAGLPVEDLSRKHLRNFLVARRASRVIGAVGFEQYGRIGLLRSLVVDKDCRASGVGRRLVEALESAARRSGVDELWLLTIDADAFFAANGYLACGRPAAPAVIRQTKEFSSLCPGDAVLMKKTC